MLLVCLYLAYLAIKKGKDNISYKIQTALVKYVAYAISKTI